MFVGVLFSGTCLCVCVYACAHVLVRFRARVRVRVGVCLCACMCARVRVRVCVCVVITWNSMFFHSIAIYLNPNASNKGLRTTTATNSAVILEVLQDLETDPERDRMSLKT